MKNPFAVAQKYLESQPQDDPFLTPETWYPEFHRFHVQIAQENPDFDRLWLREHRPDLYWQIKGLENRIDALGDARLSEVMGIMREWRELIRKAEFEQRKFEREARGVDGE